MFITTAYRRCLTLLFLINAFLNDYYVDYVIRSGWQEAMCPCHVWCEVRSLVSQQLSAVWCAGNYVKVASSLTGVWQQLFEQQDITVICTMHSLSPLAAWKPHQSSTAWIHRLKPTCLSETSEVCRKLKWYLIEMVGNQQIFVDRAIDQWRDYFNACLKANIKHFEHLLWRVSPVISCF